MTFILEIMIVMVIAYYHYNHNTIIIKLQHSMVISNKRDGMQRVVLVSVLR